MPSHIQNLNHVKHSGLNEIIEVVLDEICKITNSEIAYFALINDVEDVLTMQGWSKSAMDNCRIINKPIVYLLEETGLWGDALRERKPTITNDYKNSKKPTKKGYPEGHVEVKSHMNVPVFDGNKIVAIAGVGNKNSDYIQDDVTLMNNYLNAAWKVIKPKIKK